MDELSDLGLQQPLGYSMNSTSTVSNLDHHILAGSFRSLSLWLLAFSPHLRTLRHVNTVPGYGPHQYLSLNREKDRVFATSWAVPPRLYCWEIEPRSGPAAAAPRVNFVNSVPITAVSSYITIPPPYTHIFSAGGPTGEVHRIDADTKGFGEKVQEVLFVPRDELEVADKTRVALRYGSHGVEFTPSSSHAFIPVLGTSTIEMYTHDRQTGILTHVRSVPSPRDSEANDGPRHVKIHPNGRILYSITEHSNLVDAYRIDTASDTLVYLSSRPLLPPRTATETPSGKDRYRGDTLMLAPSTDRYPSPLVLVATTRGSSSNLRGWLSIFRLKEDGDFASDIPENVERWETPTSGGKANAIDLLPHAEAGIDGGLWILLTDDDEEMVRSKRSVGSIRVLEWKGWDKGGVQVVAQWPDEETVLKPEDRIQGASHALWLD